MSRGDVAEQQYCALKDRGIRVNCVAPGPVWTPLIPSTLPEEAVEGFGSNAPVGRMAHPDEVAPSYIFFASPRCRATTPRIGEKAGDFPDRS